MEPKIIFLDVDGVLVTKRALLEEYEISDSSLIFGPDDVFLTPIERSCIKNLKEIIDKFNAKICISSTWREVESMRSFLVSALQKKALIRALQ